MAAIIVRDFEEKCAKPYLIYVVELTETNSKTIKLAADDAIKKLGEGCDRNNLLVLVTDAAKYMLKAGKYLIVAAYISVCLIFLNFRSATEGTLSVSHTHYLSRPLLTQCLRGHQRPI